MVFFFSSETVVFTLIFDMFPSLHQCLPVQAENDIEQKSWIQCPDFQVLKTFRKGAILKFDVTTIFTILFANICAMHSCDTPTKLDCGYRTFLHPLLEKLVWIVCNDMLRLTFSFLALTSFIWLFASCKMSLSCISCTICSVHDVSCKCKSVRTQFNNTHTEHTVLRS